MDLLLAVFADTPTGNHDGPPSTSFSRAERRQPFRGRLRLARYARHRSAGPGRAGGAGKKKRHLQKEIYTPEQLKGRIPGSFVVGFESLQELVVPRVFRGNLHWVEMMRLAHRWKHLGTSRSTAGRREGRLKARRPAGSTSWLHAWLIARKVPMVDFSNIKGRSAMCWNSPAHENPQ